VPMIAGRLSSWEAKKRLIPLQEPARAPTEV
jgi:hypothetical protein